MMVPKVIFGPGYLLGSMTDLSGIVPAGEALVIKNCILNNSTGADVEAEFGVGPTTPGAGTIILIINVPTGTGIAVPQLENLVIPAGSALWALATATTSLQCVVSGFLYS